MLKIQSFTFVAILSLSLFANAIPHEDCHSKFLALFQGAQRAERITVPEAQNLASSEGVLYGKALRSAQLEIERAKQIYVVYLSADGGSAVDLVTTDRTCSPIRRIIRVQEE